MDLQALKVFQVVVETGSFSKAARVLNYAQSNISTKIQQLENDLKTPLFYRNNRGITLTAKGEMLCKYAADMFHLIDETKNAMKEDGIPSGPLCIGSMETTASVYLPKLLSTYHSNYPGVDLTLRTGTTSKNVQAVLQHMMDGAFVAGPINHADLQQEPVIKEELTLITDTIHPPISTSSDIKNRTLLVFPYGCSYRNYLEQWLHSEGVVPTKMIEFDSLGAIISSVCAGLGVSLLPISAVEQYIKAGQLSSHTVPKTYAQVPTIFVYRKDQFMSAALREFIKTFSTLSIEARD